MADKKDWREEYKKKSSEESQTETGNWRDKYKEYYDYTSAKIAGEKVTGMLDEWQKNYNSYVSDYTNRFSGRTGTYDDAYVSDSAEWLNSATEKKAALDNEAMSIFSYLNQYGGHLDAKWVQDVRDTLSKARDSQLKIQDIYAKDNAFWSSFENEDAYKYAGRADGYSKKYDGMTYENIQAALDDLPNGEERQWVQYMQDDLFKDYVKGQSDYQQYAQKGAGMNYASFDPVEQGAIMERGNEYLGAIAALFNHFGTEKKYGGHLQSYVDLFQNLTEDEWNVLAYSVAKDRENGFYTDENGVAQLKGGSMVEQFLRSMEGSLERSAGEKEAARVKDIPVIADLYAAKLGLSNFATGFNSFVNNNDTGYGSGTTQVAGNIIRESFADDGFNLPKWMGGASARQALFDLTSTTSQQIPTIAVSSLLGTINPVFGKVAGTALMGTSAAGNAYSEALEKGYGKKEARLYGSAVGALEGTLQYLLGGISKLGGVSSKLATAVSGINSGLARFALQYGGQIASEGLEEGLQEIFDPLLQRAIMDADADIDWSQVTYSALLGALSAGTLEIAPTVQSVKAQTRENNAFVSEYGGLAKDVIKNGTEGSKIGKIAEKYQKKLGKGKNLTASQVRKVLESSAQERLTELGEDGNTAKIAKMAVKYASGQELTRAEKKELSHSKFGAQVSKEIRASAMLHNLMETAAEPEYESLESRMEDETPAKVSDTGVAVISGTDQQVDLTAPKIKKITKDSVILEVNGKDVDIDEIDFANEDQWNMFNALKKIEHIKPSVASDMIAKIDTSKPIWGQMNGMDEAFTYGYYNYSEADLKAGLFTGNLTKQQLNDAYKLGQDVRKNDTDAKADAYKAMRTAAQAEVEKAAKDGKAAPGAKNLTITFNRGNGEVVSIDEAGITDPKRSGAVEVAKILHKMGLGTKIEFFESKLSDTLTVFDRKSKKVKPARVFINDAGVEQMAYSGVYRKSDGTIRVDLNAYNGRGLTLNALAHELTHFIQQWSDRKYKVLVDFLMKEYENTDMTMHQRVLREQKRLENVRGEEVSYDEAYDEVVANAMSKMFDDGKMVEKLAKLKEQDKNLAQKLWEGFKKIMFEFLGIYEKERALFDDAADLMEMKETFEQLQNMFAEALVEASENFQASLTPGVDGTAYTQSGEVIAHSTEDGSIQLSMHTYDTEGRDLFRGYLEKCVSSNQLTKNEMQEMLDGIEEIYNVCKEFKDKYAPFGTWSDAAVVRDTYGKPVFSVVTPNGEYKMNLDFSLVCKKRRTLDAVFNEMSKRGIIDDFELGQKSVVKINEIIRKYGFETACALCFVDAKRFRQASMADSFTSLYNELVLSLVPEDQRSSIDHFNFAGYETIKKVVDGIDTWDSSKLDFSHIDEVLKNYANGTVEHKAAKYIKTHAEGRKLLLRGDFMSSQGFDAVKTQNQDILRLYNSKKGTGGPKAAFGDVQYMNEIIKKARTWTPAKAYAVGGVRIQSFSDYVPRMVFDYVQMVYDLAATKLPAHAYTKEALFAKQFGLTGIKINMSLIPAIAKDGIAPGLDADGNYVWAGESFDYEIAIEIQNAEGYTENCGTICVGVSDLHIRKLLNDPNIRMVIPYHKSGLNPIVAHMNRIAQFTDYTGSQNTRDRNGSKISKDFDFDKVLHDMGENGDPKAVINQYLEWCDKNGYTPKFSQFRDHPNYYKLIEDFTLYDKDGNYVPQRGIQAVFPSDGSAFGSMKSLIEAGLQEDAVIEGKRDKSLSSIVDEIEQSLPKTEAEIPETEVKQADHDLEAGEQYSSQETDIDKDFDYSDLNWATDLGIITAKDRAIFVRTINNEILRGAKPQSANGEYIVDTGRCLMFTDGDFHRPTLSRVVEFVTEYESLTADAKEMIINEAKVTGDIQESIATIEEMFGQGFVSIGNSPADTSYGRQVRGRKRINRSGTAQKARSLKERLAEEGLSHLLEDNGEVYSSQETDIDAIERAKEHFGTTTDFEEAGYILPSGEMLKFTDDNHRGERLYDHRAIGMVYGEDVDLSVNHGFNEQSGKHLVDFVENGGIRFDPGSMEFNFDAGMQLSKSLPITAAQEQTIRDFIEWKKQREEQYNADDDPLSLYRGPLAIHIDFGGNANTALFSKAKDLDAWGVKHLSYEGGQINADRIIADIRHYYRTGETRRPSVVAQFRYSEHDTDYSNRSLLANAFEGITQNSEEYKLIQEYKGHIKNLNALEKNLSKLNEEIRKIYRTPGKRDTARLKKLTSMAEEISKEITRHDRELLSLEASEPLRKVIERERKKAAQKTKAHVQEIQQNKKVRAEQTELRHKIRKTIRDLDKILNRGNKKQNVKEDLQPVVTKALQAAEILFTDNYNTYDMLRNGIGANMSDAEEALVDSCAKMLKELDKMPADGYDNWQARQEAESKLDAKMSKLKEVFARERKRLNNTTVSSILGELADAYASLEKSEQSYVQGAYIEAVHNFLKDLQSEVGGTIVMDMTKDQLESLYAAYKMVLTTVRKANQMFNEELKQSREQLGNAVIEEVLKAGGVHLLGTKMGDAVSQFDWNNMKPIWVANRIGSDTFGKLMNGLFKGQYNFARDIDEVKKFKLKMDEKYKPRNWDAEKQYEFESSTGKKFSLKLQQIMSLYAFSKREQAYSHLLNGGFVFEENSTVVVDGKLGIKKTYIHKGAASYKLNEATLNGIIDSLTADQKAYVDEMQKYLSDVMGAKGNEVSMQLYGIQMFKEKFYFPLRSSGAYMERAKEAELKKQQGQINLVNSGFTHSVKPEAKNPIVLSGFMDVWAEHCNEMSMYHSMVLPMEDFRKVYNYSTIHDENMESASVYQTIQDAYGKAATNYIDQLYKELNAGATVDPRETPWKHLISKFKMSSVMLSLSVWVQQFSSIGRAYAVIDPKYFTGAKVDSHTKLVVADEMKKYAPVAIIKEMGGFDTGTKGNATAYIKAEKYGKDERIKGLVKDEQYRSDIMGYMPTKADEKTWCAIWEAVKRETKANHPKMDVKSDEFLKLAGERFSEVIEKTQVYDSVLARSANMRSKGNFMAMATAFMAEPTTTINLIEDAIRSGNKKYLARTFGSVAVSILLNNALASIVYALRDDDEDETFIEKYFQSFTSGLIDDFNPMSYYPFLKDIYSMLQGYDVERTDMAVFADVRDACKQVLKYLTEDTSEMDDDEIAKHNKNLWGAFGSCLDAVCSAFGVPLKNVRRDTLAIVNGIKTIGTDLSGERATTWNSFWDNVGAAVKDTIPIYALVAKDKAKTDKLYTAIISGDKSYLSRLKSTYKTDSAYQSAVRKALRENDPRIKAAAQAGVNGNSAERNRIFKEIKSELGADYANYIIDAINAEVNKIRNDAKPDKVAGQYEAYDFVEAVSAGDANTAKAVREDIISTYKANGKTQTQAEKAFVSDVKSSVNEAYSYGTISKATAEKMLVEYADMDEEDAADKITYWDFRKTNPNCDLSESKVLDYLEFAEPAHVSLEVYEQFVSETKDLTDIKDKWGDVEVTKKEQVLEVIDSLPLSWQQKDALYLAYGYEESQIWDVPW